MHGDSMNRFLIMSLGRSFVCYGQVIEVACSLQAYGRLVYDRLRVDCD